MKREKKGGGAEREKMNVKKQKVLDVTKTWNFLILMTENC